MTTPDFAGADRLAAIATGNDHLITQPGLVDALYRGQATPTQASVLNSFVGGLNAELKVRNAAKAGKLIPLTQEEIRGLDANGIDYSRVIQRRQPVPAPPTPTAPGSIPAAAGATVQTATPGQPVPAANIKTTDGKGFQIYGETVDGGWLDKIGKTVVNTLTGGRSSIPGTEYNPTGDIYTAVVNPAFNVASTIVSEQRDYANITKYAAHGYQESEAKGALMRRLGYDPNSVHDVLAFDSKGYAYNDTSSVEAAIDKQYKGKFFGMTPKQAVLEAMVYNNDPGAYQRTAIKGLDTKAAGAKINFFNSEEWQDLVKRVEYEKASAGHILARSMGINYTDHSASQVSGLTDTALSLMGDPLAIGLKSYGLVQKSSIAVKGLEDAEGIRRVLTQTIGQGATRAVLKNQWHLQHIVDLAGDVLSSEARHSAREITTAQHEINLAKIQAEADANPYGNLLPGFLGRDDEGNKVGDIITHYDDAVEAIVSKSALIRLVGGKSMTEFGLMPGATSSYFASRMRGQIGQWWTGRTLTKTGEAAEKTWIKSATADPEGVGETLVTEGVLRRVLPREGDAVQFEVTPTGRGVLQRNILDYGRTIGSTGGLEGAQKAAARVASDKRLTSLAGNAQQAFYGLTGTGQRLAFMAKSMFSILGDREVSVARGSDGDKIYRVAKTYMNIGDAKLARARWTFGDAMTRKAIVEGVEDQLYHAAGLGRTRSGRAWLADQYALRDRQVYSAVDGDYIDPNGRAAALHPSQAQLDFTLPHPGQLHMRASKIGLYETTMGRVLNVQLMTAILLPLWKLATLAHGVTGTRAIAETMLGVTADRSLGFQNVQAAKAILKEAGSYERMSGLKRTALTRALADTIGFRDVGQLVRDTLKSRLDPDVAMHIAKMPEDILHTRITGQLRAHTNWELDPTGNWEAREITDAGFDVAAVKYGKGDYKKNGFEITDDVDGREGARAYAFSLAVRANHTSDQLLKTLMEYLEQKTYGLPQPLKRYGRDGEDLSAPPAHGTAFSYDRPGETNHFESNQLLRSSRHGLAPNDPRLLSVANHSEDGVTSAGLSALKSIDPDEYERVLKMNTKALRAAIKKRFPDAEVDKSLNGQLGRLQEAYGAMVAREEGYHAIHVSDPTDQAYDEYLALTEHGLYKGDAIQRGKVREVTIKDVEAALEADPRTKHIPFGKIWRDADGKQHNVISPDEAALSKEQWTEHLVQDWRHFLTGQDDTYRKEIADYIRSGGTAPHADWLHKHVPNKARPATMIKPTYVPVGPDLDKLDTWREKLNGFAQNLMDLEGKAYQFLVEKHIQRHAVGPVFALAYGQARKNLDGLAEKFALVHGQEVADRMVADLAAHQAWNKIATLVDDPNLKTHMDVIGRGFFAFSRATNTALRRWGGIAYRNPEQARRAQLLWEAANHSGLIYDDPSTGEPMFMVPGSGVAQEAMIWLHNQIPGLPQAMFPTGNYKGKVASIVPGSNNPFQYSTTPFVSIGGRAAADALGGSSRLIFDEVDKALNGEAGQGQGLLATLLPREAKQFSDAEINDARDSVMNSAMIGALYTMMATGKVPSDVVLDKQGNVIRSRSPRETQEFYDRLKTGTKNVLFLRFLMGNLSPATLSMGDGMKADPAFADRGIKSMRDEFKTLISDNGGDYMRALAVWQQMHPDLAVFTSEATKTLTKSARVSPSVEAYEWMTTNKDFIHNYKDVAAYFIPEGTNKSAFSLAAYRAQKEGGFREGKLPQEFVDGTRISEGSEKYFAYEDSKNAALAAAGNDTARKQNINANWKAWSEDWKARNPTFAAYLGSMGGNKATANNAFEDLSDMVRRNEVPGSQGTKDAVAELVTYYTSFRQWLSTHTQQDKVSVAQRANAHNMLQSYFDQTIKAHPELKDLYNGVFRPMNGNLDYAQ